MERGLSRLSKEVRVSGRCREKKQLVLLVAQLFDPIVCPRDSPGKYTGVGCHFLLQGILLNSGLLPCRQILHRLRHQGSCGLRQTLSRRECLLFHSFLFGFGCPARHMGS